MRVGGLLEYQIVVFQAEWVAGKFECDVVVAAERQPAEGVARTVIKLGDEFDAAGRDDVRRNGDDRRAGRDRAFRRYPP